MVWQRWRALEHIRCLSFTGRRWSLPIARASFFARWAFLTARQPRRALEHIMYLGFEGDASELFRISRPRRAEQRSKGDAPVRSVYQV